MTGSVLLPPSCVHFWLDIAECLMCKEKHAKTLLQDDSRLLSFGLETSPCSPCTWNGTRSLQKGQVRGGNRNKSPRLGGTHVLCLGRALDLLSGSLHLPSGVRAAERDRWTCVPTHSSIAGHWVREAKMVIKQNFQSHSATSCPSRFVDDCPFQSERNGKNSDISKSR